MIQRCTNPRAHQYADYGGRGVRVCKRWRKFENFYADMGERPAGKTLDRVDRNGNYTPRNCRWATRVEQSINRRHRVVWNGMCHTHIARMLGVTWDTLLQHVIEYGDYEKAVKALKLKCK